jgi:hypothetical protein
MMAWYRRPWFPALLVLFVLGCSSGQSQGCGSSSSADQTCDIDTMATTCPGEITLECHDGAKPFSKTHCRLALQESTDILYCCTNEADPESDGGGGAGGN